MDGDPYARMAALMRNEGAVSVGTGATFIRLGRVVSREPLEVSAGGLRLPAEALRINERLTKGAKWKTKLTAPVDVLNDPARRPAGTFDGVQGPVTGTVGCGAVGCGPEPTGITGGTLYSDEVIIDQAEYEQLEIDLAVGDQVLMLTEDDQIFYILMKVVDAV